jgi:uncharacterized protein YjbJ (UPF0337 family)
LDGNHSPINLVVLIPKHIRSKIMDKDRIKGVAEQAKGKVKEAFGKLTGDAKLEAEGKAEIAAGKVENAVGGAKDKIREATERK